MVIKGGRVELAPGSSSKPRVRLLGLKTASLNGVEGRRGKWCDEKERFEVEVAVDGGKPKLMLIRDENMEFIDLYRGKYIYSSEGVVSMMENLSHMVSTKASECAVRADYEREMLHITTSVGLSRIDQIVSSSISGAIQASNLGLSQIHSYSVGEPESLNIILSEPSGGVDKEIFKLVKIFTVLAAVGNVALMRNLLRSPYMVMAKYMEASLREGVNKVTDALGNTVEMTVSTALIYEHAFLAAASAGQAGIVQLLLDEDLVSPWMDGSNVNHCDIAQQRNTPFYMAAQNNRLDAVRAMMRCSKIDVNAYGISHVSSGAELSVPLITCCDKGLEEMVSLLLSHPNIEVNKAEPQDFYTPLIAACVSPLDGVKLGNLGTEGGIVKQLLARPEIDVNHKESNGRTALHTAARAEGGGGELLEITRLLLAHPKIEVDAATNSQPDRPAIGSLTPLKFAEYSGNKETAALIKEHRRLRGLV